MPKTGVAVSVVFALCALCVGGTGCSKGSDGGSSCGGLSQYCCANYVCDAGLSCQTGLCQTGDTPCGARDQACCSTGAACTGTLVCQTGTCTTGTQAGGSGTICASGGTLAIAGATLTIPPGALAACTRVTLSTASGPPPDGYTAYTPVIGVEPAGQQLAVPATLTLDLDGTPELPTAFWSRVTGDLLEPVGGTVANGTMTMQISRFGRGFVAGRDYVLVCAQGGTLALPGATLTIPEGAVSGCTMVKLTQTADSLDGYTPYSPSFRVEPEALELASPASISVDFAGDEERATLFWSRVQTTGFERVFGAVSNGSVTGEITRFGTGFVGDGVNFVDPPDRSCVVSKMVEGRTMAPSTVALFFTADDCWGRPIPGLASTDFTVLEDGSPISPAESSATILQRNGVEVFASLVIDLSASTLPHLPNVIASAKSFVTELQITRQLPVQIDIQVFAGDEEPTEWQPPTLDTARLLDRLDGLATFTPADRSSTNLNGAIVSGLSRLDVAQQTFRDRNYGGAFTIGYLVLFTDGSDTAGRLPHAVAVSAVSSSPDQIVAVGLQSAEFDAESLAELAPNGVITAPDASQLGTAFAILADRMDGQIDRFYLLGYCSPKRAGTSHAVSVGLVGATNHSEASYAFSAVGFTSGCSAATFDTICENRQCGGLGCGACDDRVAACDPASSLCVNNCLAQGLCAGGPPITNALGYEQSCTPIPSNTSCGAACVDTTTDPTNCGGCGNACGAGQHCAAGTCVD